MVAIWSRLRVQVPGKGQYPCRMDVGRGINAETGDVNVYKGGGVQINVYKDKCIELLEMMKMWS